MSAFRCDLANIAGVCLGMQAIAKDHGARIVRSTQPVHGRLSDVTHTGEDIFAGIRTDETLRVVRYHSLEVDSSTADSSRLRVTAWSLPGDASIGEPDDKSIMGLQSTTLKQWGVQFHPESIATDLGRRIIENFKQLVCKHYGMQVHPAGTNSSRDILTDLNLQLKPPINGPPRPSDFAARAASSAKGFDQRKAKRRYCLKWSVHEHALFYSTPGQIFWEVVARDAHDGSDCFWLDSSSTEAGRARFSFMGAPGGSCWRKIMYKLASEGSTMNKVRVFDRCGIVEEESGNTQESVFALLKRKLEHCECADEKDQELPFNFCGGYVGFFGYEIKAQSGGSLEHESPHHDAAFLFADRFVALDHLEGHAYLVALCDADVASESDAPDAWLHETGEALSTLRRRETFVNAKVNSSNGNVNEATEHEFAARRSRKQYEDDVRSAKERIAAGQTYEVCLTTVLSTPRERFHAHHLYSVMRERVPAPHGALLDFGNESESERLQICSSSPERFLRLTKSGELEAKPIKGTRKRVQPLGCEEDQAIAKELADCTKDRAENLMIVDLLRNDLGRVSELGSVHVPDGKLFDIESFSAVHQLVTTVRSKKLGTASAIDCIQAGFPGGSMTGAPKKRTMKVIDELEAGYRGPYSGSIGYIGINGTFDLSIVIRSVIVSGDIVEIGAGGAVVALSDPSEEYDEMRLKARALQAAVKEAGNASK